MIIISTAFFPPEILSKQEVINILDKKGFLRGDRVETTTEGCKVYTAIVCPQEIKEDLESEFGIGILDIDDVNVNCFVVTSYFKQNKGWYFNKQIKVLSNLFSSYRVYGLDAENIVYKLKLINWI